MSLRVKRHYKLFVLLALALLVACGGGLEAVSPIKAQVESPTSQAPAVEATVVEAAAASGEAGQAAAAGSVAEAAAENREDHDDAQDYTWDELRVVSIALNGDSIAVAGSGVLVAGSRATITAAGTYRLSGALADGQIVVDTQDEGIVRLILAGVDISSSTSAPLYVMNAEKTVIVLADGTENYVSDAASYVFADPEEDEPNAAIFSKEDLTLCGGGALTVEGRYNDGIASKDGLVVNGGTIVVNAVDDGLRGKDYLVVKDGHLTVTAGGDGLKSDEEEDATRGYLSIEAGTVEITAGGDAIQAATEVLIAAGTVTLTSGGGSNSRLAADISAKGIKAGAHLAIAGGHFAIDAADDAIHSNGSLVIDGGTFVISTGDDALHADSTLEINGGQIQIIDSYEGIESSVITINDGEIHVVASDDGLNVAGGNDGSGTMMGPGQGGRPAPGGGPGQDAFRYTGDYYLYINGGSLVIEAGGDGIDSNGAVEMSGGLVIVHGPTENMNGALDFGSFEISGGFLVAAGSAGMAQVPGESSSQCSVLLNLGSALPAGTLFHIQSSDGQEILTFAPAKRYQSIAFSSPALAEGATYEVYYGGSDGGEAGDGLYEAGAYTPGSLIGSFTISGIVTRLGSGRR